ncbi:MAG: hypothetical protein ABFQ65_02320 [Nanoarchaeota archaeon]
MINIHKSLSPDHLKDIAETLNCTSNKFYGQLIKKAVLQQILKIPDAVIINTEETIKQKTNFPYMIYHNKEFYFVRIDTGKIPHKKKITREKSELEKILKIDSTEILCFNPLTLSPKRTIKKLKKGRYELIDLGYNEQILKGLKHHNKNSKHLRGFTPVLKYNYNSELLGMGTYEQKKEIINYCLGQNLSEKEKKNNCEEGLIKESKNNCRKCRNSLKLVLESEVKTQNPLNRQAIKYLESVKKTNLKLNDDLDYAPTNTELSKLAQKLL